MTEENENLAQTVERLVDATACESQIDGRQFARLPQGYQIHDLEKFQAHPQRKRGKKFFVDVESFCRYVTRHQTAATALYVNTETATMLPLFECVLNDHEIKTPGWKDFVAVLTFKMRPEWQTWFRHDRQWLTQADFAEFIEENEKSITAPNSAELLELVQTLEGKKNVTFKSGQRLQTGAQAIEYLEEIELRGNVGTNKGRMQIPATLSAAIAPYFGAPPYNLAARVKYRISDGGKLSFQFQTIDPHLVIDHATKEVCKAIETATNLPPYFVND